MLPTALLFDMDGTLTDTEALWVESENRTLESLGSSWRGEDTKDIIGMDLTDAAAHIIEVRSLDITAVELANLLVDGVVKIGREQGMPWRPGAYELLELSVELGIPSALVTSSYIQFAELALENAPTGSLTSVVTGDQVTHGKPHPEPFLAAADKLDVPIGESMAFEDSRPGLVSAHSAGAITVGVPFQVELPRLKGVRIVRSLSDIGRQELERLVSGEGYL